MKITIETESKVIINTTGDELSHLRGFLRMSLSKMRDDNNNGHTWPWHEQKYKAANTLLEVLDAHEYR